MSGHSKWKNIAARKGKVDAARGKIFTKLGRELLVAVKQGGPDPSANFKLKDIIAKCKANNMPNDTINNAIKKASGEGALVVYEEITYEGYGIGGVAIIVETSTDNRNRTAADVRHIFDKFGGKLGTTGCVSYLFEKKGIIVIDKSETKLSEDDLMLSSIDAGAEDFITTEEVYEIKSSPNDFSKVTEELDKLGIVFLEASVQMVPSTYILLDEGSCEKMQRLIEGLEDLDDVLEVFHNWEE